MKLLISLAAALQKIPAAWRRVAYLLLVAVCAVLVSLGHISEDESAEALELVAELLGIAAGGIAAANVPTRGDS